MFREDDDDHDVLQKKWFRLKTGYLLEFSVHIETGDVHYLLSGWMVIPLKISKKTTTTQ